MKFLKSKKIVALALMVMLALSVFALAGCTPEGTEYLKAMKDASSIDEYTMNGDMTMSFDFTGLMGDAQLSAADKEMFDMMKNIKITYTGAAKVKDGLFEMKMKMKFGSKAELPMDVYMKGTTMLMNAPQFVNMMEVLGGAAAKAEVEATKKALAGVEWMDLNTMTNALSGVDYSNIDYAALSTSIYDFVDYLNANSYKDYAPKSFAKKGDGYEMKVTPEQLAPLTKEFLTYSLTHYDAIVKDLKAYVEKADKSIFTVMGVTKADALALLNELPKDAKALTKEQIAQLEALVDEACKYINGTSFDSYISKVANKKYSQTMNLNFVFVNPENATEKISFTVKATAAADGSQPVTINYPTTGVKSTKELQVNVKPSRVTGTLYVKSGTFRYAKVYAASIFNEAGVKMVTVKEKDGSIYLPMRQVAEILGKEVIWENNTAYVAEGDKKIKVEGLQFDGSTYLKIREFEKLGFTVDYQDELGGIVTFDNGK